MLAYDGGTKRLQWSTEPADDDPLSMNFYTVLTLTGSDTGSTAGASAQTRQIKSPPVRLPRIDQIELSPQKAVIIALAGQESAVFRALDAARHPMAIHFRTRRLQGSCGASATRPSCWAWATGSGWST